MAGIERCQLVIATFQHCHDIGMRPRVHAQRSYLAGVDAQSTMASSAGYAKERPVRYGRPLGLMLLAIDAFLVAGQASQKLQTCGRESLMMIVVRLLGRRRRRGGGRRFTQLHHFQFRGCGRHLLFLVPEHYLLAATTGHDPSRCGSSRSRAKVYFGDAHLLN